MSDEFDSMELPDELRDVAGRLRGLRPAAAKASEAECMYRAGWKAALASQATLATRSASSWKKSYLGGLISGAVVSGSLAAAVMLGMATSWNAPEAVRDGSRLGRETIAQTPDWSVAQNSSAEPNDAQRSSPLETGVAPLRTMSDELVTTALLSPVARQQWRASLTRAAAPYASARTESASDDATAAEPLRSSPRDIDLSLF